MSGRTQTIATYDGDGNCLATQEECRGPRSTRGPVFSHTQEFRLTGSGRVTAVMDLPFDVPDEIVVAITRVRASLARPSDPGMASSAIGGVDARAEVQGDGILLSARLSDFARADLVVVQMDVAVYACGSQGNYPEEVHR